MLLKKKNNKVYVLRFGKKENEEKYWRRKDNAPQRIKEPQGEGEAKERMAGKLRASELEAM